MLQLSRRIDRILPQPTQSSVTNDPHRRFVHEKARCRLTPGGINRCTIKHANGRNRFRADVVHLNSLRDEGTGDENRLLSHFFVSRRGALGRRIGKRGADRD